jgi:hypothetical protein
MVNWWPHRHRSSAAPAPETMAGGGPDVSPTIIRNPVPDLVISAERGDDLVLLDLLFYGFELATGNPPAITPTSADNVLVVQFPPQAIAEGVYPWGPGGENLPVDPPPILSEVSGPSRLCFSLAPGQTIPLPTMTISDLLDWSGWKLLVPAVAQVHGPSLAANRPGPPPPVPTPPTELETAIEIPYALFLAPAVYASGDPEFGFSTGFTSRVTPLVSPAGVVDLWSASLTGSPKPRRARPGPPVQTAGSYVPSVSAVWARDYDATSSAAVADATPEQKINYGEPTQ